MEKLKCFIIVSILSFSHSGFAQDIEPFEFRYDTYVTELKNDSTTIRASVYYFTPEKKLRLNKKYHWLVKDSIIETNANYSGKLLHGNYEELYKNGQLKTKGEFKNGFKIGKWYFWNERGDMLYTEIWRIGKKRKVKLSEKKKIKKKPKKKTQRSKNKKEETTILNGDVFSVVVQKLTK